MTNGMEIVSIKHAMEHTKAGIMKVQLRPDHLIEVDMNDQKMVDFFTRTNKQLEEISHISDLSEWERKAEKIIYKNIKETFGEYDTTLDNSIRVTEHGKTSDIYQKLDCDVCSVLTAYLMQQNCPDPTNEYQVFESFRIDREDFVQTLKHAVDNKAIELYSHAGIISTNTQQVIETTTGKIYERLNVISHIDFSRNSNNYYIGEDCDVVNFATYGLKSAKDLHSVALVFASNDLVEYLNKRAEISGADNSSENLQKLNRFLNFSRGNVESENAAILTMLELAVMAMGDDGKITKSELRTMRNIKSHLTDSDFKELGATMANFNVKIEKNEGCDDIFTVEDKKNNRSYSIPVNLDERKIPKGLLEF